MDLVLDKTSDVVPVREHDPARELVELQERRTLECFRRMRNEGRVFAWQQHYGDMLCVNKSDTKSNVYRTTYRDAPGKLIAIKVKRSDSDAAAILNLKEVIILRERACNHPNVVRMLGAHITPMNVIYIEMDFHQQTVLDMITAQDSPATAVQIRDICRDVLAALVYLHLTVSVLHGDIKAANLLIADDGRVVVADFDVSVHIPSKSHTLASWEVNSAGAKPIEAIVLQPFTFSPDLWALGCMIEHICAPKRRAMRGKSAQDQVNIMHAFAGPLAPKFFDLTKRPPRPDKHPPWPVMPTGPVVGFDAFFAHVPAVVRPFLRTLLTVDPDVRASAMVALVHPFMYMDLGDDEEGKE